MQLLASIIKWLIYVTSILVILLSVSVFTLDVTTCACNQQSDLTITATMGQIILAFLMALSSTPALYHYWSPRLIYILMMVALSILLLVTRQFAAADYRFPLVSPVMVNALLGILFCYLMYERTGGGQDFCISLVQENFYESPPSAATSAAAAASEDAARRNSSKESKTSDQLSASNETRVTIFSSTDNSTGNSGGVGNNNTNGIVSLEQSQNMKNNMHNKKGDDFSAKNNSTQQQQQQQVSPMQMRASPIRRVTSTVKRKNVPFATAKNKDKINNNKNKYIDNNNNKDKDNINNRKANTTGAETPGTISSTDENGDLREKLANKAMPIDSLQI